MSIAYRESLKICDSCGEIYDANVEIERIHHSQVGDHAPLLPPRRNWRRPALAMMLARAS